MESNREVQPSEHPGADPVGISELDGISGLDLRRAVTRVLLRRGEPMSIGEVVRALASTDGVVVAGRAPGAETHHRISGLLSHQVQRGRVRRVSHGRYEVLPDQISRTDRWRIDRWERFSWALESRQP